MTPLNLCEISFPCYLFILGSFAVETIWSCQRKVANEQMAVGVLWQSITLQEQQRFFVQKKFLNANPFARRKSLLEHPMNGIFPASQAWESGLVSPRASLLFASWRPKRSSRTDHFLHQDQDQQYQYHQIKRKKETNKIASFEASKLQVQNCQQGFIDR